MLEHTSNHNQAEKLLASQNVTGPPGRALEVETANVAETHRGVALTDCADFKGDIVNHALSEMRAHSPQGKTFTYCMCLSVAAWAAYDTVDKYRTAVGNVMRDFRVVGLTAPTGTLEWFHDRLIYDIRQVVFVCSIALCAEGLSQARKSRKRRKAMQSMAKLMDCRSIASMIDAIRYDPAVRTTAIEGLMAILPRLGTEDRELFGRYQRRELNHLLRMASADISIIELQCAIISALEQIGDTTSLNVVTELAYGRGRIAPAVREAALNCIPGLKALLGPQHGSNELLRASASECQTADTLMRPASAGGPANKEELLRVVAVEI